MIKSMIFSMFSFLLLSTGPVNGEPNHQSMIEFFDIEQGAVFKEVSHDQMIQSEVHVLLTSINGLVKNIQPIPPRGFIVKIPLEPNITVNNEWYHDLVDEVFIFYPVESAPFILVFDQENRPYFFTLAKDATNLLLLLQ